MSDDMLPVVATARAARAAMAPSIPTPIKNFMAVVRTLSALCG